MLPGLMASRIREQQRVDLTPDLPAISAPTLVVSGEPELDRVVPVDSTRQYAARIRSAKYVMIERTGHIGLMTQPDTFARIITDFVIEHADHHPALRCHPIGPRNRLISGSGGEGQHRNESSAAPHRPIDSHRGLSTMPRIARTGRPARHEALD